MCVRKFSDRSSSCAFQKAALRYSDSRQADEEESEYAPIQRKQKVSLRVPPQNNRNTQSSSGNGGGQGRGPRGAAPDMRAAGRPFPSDQIPLNRDPHAGRPYPQAPQTGGPGLQMGRPGQPQFAGQQRPGQPQFAGQAPFTGQPRQGQMRPPQIGQVPTQGRFANGQDPSIPGIRPAAPAAPPQPPRPRPMQPSRPSVTNERPPMSAPEQRPQQGPPPKLQSGRRLTEVFSDEQMQLFTEGKFSDLYFDLQNMMHKFPNNVDGFFGLGLCSMAVGEPERAATHFLKALKLDDSMRPGDFIVEISSSDPEDWMLMAETLGHEGFVDAAVDICKKITSSDRYPPKIRALASKTKETIEQDYFAARERIAAGNGPKQEKDSTGTIRFASVVTFVLMPILITFLVVCWAYSSFQLSEGKGYMRAGIYRYERIKEGNKAMDNQKPTESYFEAAEVCLKKAEKFNPLAVEPLYYRERNFYMYHKLGEYRNRDKYQRDQFAWSAGRLKTVEDNRKSVVEKIKGKNLSVEKLEEEKKGWQEFYNIAKSDPGTVIF